jgi:hypothetical protein
MRFGTSDAYLVRWLFLRGMALVWLAAFLSLAVQVQGLAGPEGILPAQRTLDAVRDAWGTDALLQAPTVCWWTGAGARTLDLLCAGGVGLAVLAAVGVLPGPCLLLLCAVYLSLAVVCSTFLQFQWDLLLQEAGLLAAFLAPWKAWAPGLARDRPPSRTVLVLLRLLLFKLLFLSGVVKLTSGDPTWHDLTALRYHYWTTCLPTWTGWWMYQLPDAFHRASAVGMFVAELGVPFLFFAPWRRVRAAAAAAEVGLQAAIAATGNYGFFNLLAVVLCIPVLDDTTLRAGIPVRWRERLATPSADAWVPAWRRAPAFALAAVVLPLSLLQMQAHVLGVRSLPGIAVRALQAAQPWRSVNGYGLFANMTTTRFEIVVEGSNDGETWLPYAFRYKPGDPLRRPRFIQPHMPRLDWQMWFAALSDWRRQPWFLNLLERLLEGSPPVVALLENDPFPDAPPRRIRAVLWDYRFTDREERRVTGAWWKRERRGLYCPVLERDEEGGIRIVP